MLRHSGASGSMSFAWSLYDRIIDLSDAFANHFNNLLALDFQEETVQVGQDANQGQWRQVERGRRTNRADPQADQARRESLAQKLTLDTVAPNMDVHTALFKDLLAFQFASPGTYGLDELWDGTQLKWQCADLHAGVSRHAPLLYELESPDPQASNYWALENRMVGEVNYVQLFHWIQNQSTLWQEGISTVFVYVDNRPLSDPSQCPNFWGLFCPWLLARCSYLGPFQEITTAIHVPIDASSGLDKVHFTWAGTFVLEALVYLFPDKHIILIDTDCVPTSFFEVEELVRMTQTHLDQAAGVEPNTIRGNRKPACKSAVFLCSEAKAEINAGMIIITNCRLQRPHAATEPATSMAKGLLGSRQAYIRSSHPSPNVDQLASSGLLWTPMATAIATLPVHWTHAWALLGEWANHITFPLPKASPDGKIVWPRHGSADLLGQTYQTRSPPFVMWAFPAFEQGALSPLVFLPATFPIRVLPGDKLFQSRVVREDCTLAPVTHAFGGSKLRVGDMLKRAGGPPLPLVAAMRGVENKLPLWACDDGCDFIRGTRLMNVTLKPQDLAISNGAASCLLSMWRVIDPVFIQPDLCKAAKYTVPLIDLPDCLPKFQDSAVSLLSQMADFSNTVLLDSIQSVWHEWNSQDRSIFQFKWIETIVNSGVLLGLGPRRQLLIECSGLGGAPIFDSIQGDLFLKCMSTTPVYGPSLAHLDIYDDNQKYRRTTSIGRTAQIHDFHMLHAAAWPKGVKAWTRILGLMHMPDLHAAHPDKILTQASVLAATGKRLPAHLRDAHPGFELGLRLILDCLLPVQLRTYLTNVLSPLLTEASGWLMASADPSIREANRELHIIGHSAGSFTAMVLSDILQDPQFGPFFGCTRATAIAMPSRLFETHYTQRTIRLYHVQEDELCVWRPTKEDLALLNDHGIEVTLISGNALWMGKRNHSYGHFVFSGLEPGTFSISKVLNVPGVVPLFEKQKAPLRLMSWCTYRMSESSKHLLQTLSARCGDPTTTEDQLVSIAQLGLPRVNTVLALKEWLLQQLLCQVDGKVLPNCCGVLGEFLMDLPLPRIIYMLDYYLPQLQPWDKGSLHELSTMAAPIHYCPQKMYMYFQRQDDEFCHYSFVNEGGNPFVMTPTDAPKCFHTIDYVKKFEGKPLEIGRVIAIVFNVGSHTTSPWFVIGIVMDSRPRGRAKWLNDTTVPPQERGYAVTHHKCNPRSLDLALLRVEAATVFCDSTMRAICAEFPNIFYYDLAGDPIPEHIHVREVFAIGHTRTAKELIAVSQIPPSRVVRGLGLLTENVAADAIPPPRKATLQSLLCRLLRRMLTPWHVPMPELTYDSWFRTKVLPIAADEDGHVVAATSAVALALATGKLDVCVQGLFGAGKSRAAAILLLGLMALDTEGECHFQVICKENTGTRSFIEMIEYLQFPTELYKCIGRIVSDREAQNAASTYFDIRHSAKTERLPKCRLLVMTGGSFANDRCSNFPALDEFLSKLMLTIFDEAQQFGGDREVTTVALLPPTCLVVWMGDAQQTPGGIAKGHDQFAISRRQLMMRKHGLRCPQTDVTPHSLSTVLCALLQEVDDPSATALAEVLASASSNLGPLWVDQPNQDQSATLDILDTFCPGGNLRWQAPSTQDIQNHPQSTNVLVGSACNPTTLSIVAYICSVLDRAHEWLPHIQAKDTLSAASAAGLHAWGLMLPTSTRTPGVCYTCTVAVRYDPLCTLLHNTQTWSIGTHTRGGVEGLVGGYQFVHWKRPPGELVYARATDLSCIIKNVYNALYAVKGKEGTLLTMSARNEEKDTLIASGNFRGHTKIKIQSVASSAGGTAMMAIVAQPYRGHLNGNVNDEFDMEECYARATVAGTRAQSLTVIVSPLDMQGMIGMMQVLAGRAHTIHEVYRGNDNWQLPQLEEPQMEQSNAEVQSWRISHAGTWAEQNLPPLAIGFNLRRNVDGQERVVFLRLRLVLVKASKIPSARTHISQLEHIVQRAYDTRRKLTLPDQRTEELMIWGYAIDKQHRVMAWLGPACSSQEPFAPLDRHWRSGTIMHTVPLPGMHFFDAWRIRSQLTPDSKLGEKLPSLGTNELIPEEPANEDYGQGDRADIQHRREQERDVRGATKTIAQLALEMSHVHRLADLIKEKANLLKELAMRRKSYQDEVKESAKGKSTAASSAPKKQRTTGAPASAVNPVPTPLPTAHGGKAMEVDAGGSTSQSSSTPFPWPFTQSPSTSGTPATPKQHDPPSVPAPAPQPDVQQDEQASVPHQKGVQAGAPPIPRAFCDEILTVLSNLPEEWPLVKIDLLLNKAETYYVSWRRFLYLNERLRTLDTATAARTIPRNKDRILEHLVQVLSEWIVASIEPAKELTRTKEPEFMFLHTKDFWFRSIWIDLHQALTIDRVSSRDRAPIGLVRCICKDDYVKGKHAHVKFKLSNIHAFVPVWMAPMMLKNFRLIAAQSSPVSPLGQLDYREGWFAIIPKEGQPGETLCGIQVHLNDKFLAEFPNRDWPAIEHWAEKGVLKPDVWKARRTNLSLIVKLEIPISGTAIQVQQQALQLDQVPDSWPCNLESGWAAHYGRLDMPFEAMCQHLVQNQFTSDAFQGDSDSYLFQWSTNVWDTWPDVEGQNFKEDWDKEGHINHPKRSETALTTEDIHQLQQDTPIHNELRAPMNQFMERQFANQEPLRNNLLIPTLEARINQAAKLRGALAQMVHAISRNFTIRDTNQIMEQLIIRCQGDLNVYIRNETLMHNHCMEIVGSLGLTMLDTMLSVDD